jgi:hypothetical protein
LRMTSPPTRRRSATGPSHSSAARPKGRSASAPNELAPAPPSGHWKSLLDLRGLAASRSVRQLVRVDHVCEPLDGGQSNGFYPLRGLPRWRRLLLRSTQLCGAERVGRESFVDRVARLGLGAFVVPVPDRRSLSARVWVQVLALRLLVVTGVVVGFGPVCLASAGVARASGWESHAVPVPGRPDGELAAVSCTSRPECTAVGSYYYGTDSEGATAPLVQRWDGKRWSIKLIDDLGPANASYASLSGVSCTSVTFCLAVGYYSIDNGPRTVIERLNGANWSIQSPAQRVGQLSAVSCVSPKACVAVGFAGAGVPLVDRWNGSRWSSQIVRLPVGALEGFFNGVSCVSTTICVAVGFADYRVSGYSTVSRALIARLSGTTWSVQPILDSAGSLVGVSCVSKHLCTAVSAWGAIRWNGVSWTSEPIERPAGVTGPGLSDVSCSSAAACTAVGTFHTHAGTRVSLMERWNGAKWSIQPTPDPASATAAGLSGVSCSSSGACTTVGSFISRTHTMLTLAERARRTSWNVQRTPNAEQDDDTALTGVSCSSASACTAIGTDYTGRGYTELAERWNGATWSLQRTPVPAATPFVTLTEISCPTASMCLTVGQASTISSVTSGVALAEVWDGGSWRVAPTPTLSGAITGTLTGVACPSITACMAVGYYETAAGNGETLAESWNGSGWTVVSTPSPGLNGSLSGVSCTSGTACTAVGSFELQNDPGISESLAERWDGSSWTVQSTPNPSPDFEANLTAVSCSSDTACTAVGYFWNDGRRTLAEAWDGTSWTLQQTPTPPAGQDVLNAVSCTSATACTAVGDDGAGLNYGNYTLAEAWNGTDWTGEAIPNPTGASTSSLNSVSCTTITACTVVGGFLLTAFGGSGPHLGVALVVQSS